MNVVTCCGINFHFLQGVIQCHAHVSRIIHTHKRRTFSMVAERDTPNSGMLTKSSFDAPFFVPTSLWNRLLSRCRSFLLTAQPYSTSIICNQSQYHWQHYKRELNEGHSS